MLDAKTGQVLYRFNTGGSIGGGVITYFFGGSGLPAVVIFAAESGAPSL